MGMCSCVAGGTGAICKHQIAVAEATMTALPQLFVASIANRKLLAEVALGMGNVPAEIFQDLVKSEPQIAQSSDNLDEHPCSHDMSATIETAVPSMRTTAVLIDDDSDDFTTSPPKFFKSSLSESLILDLTSSLNTCIHEHGNEETVEAVKKFLSRLKSIRNSNSLNSFLYSAGSTLGARRGHSRGKIPVQPTSTERRRAGMPRGASTVGRGRPPALAPTKKLKRKHNLALNINDNVPSAR